MSGKLSPSTADVAKLQTSAAFVRGVLGRYDETLVLSCQVQHFKSKKKTEKLILCVTTGSLYLVKVSSKGNPERRIPLNIIKSVLTPVTNSQDLYICVHHEYDAHIRTSYRPQILKAMQMHQSNLTIVDLPMNIIDPMLQDKHTWKKAHRGERSLKSALGSSNGSSSVQDKGSTYITTLGTSTKGSSSARGSMEGSDGDRVAWPPTWDTSKLNGRTRTIWELVNQGMASLKLINMDSISPDGQQQLDDIGMCAQLIATSDPLLMPGAGNELSVLSANGVVHAVAPVLFQLDLLASFLRALDDSRVQELVAQYDNLVGCDNSIQREHGLKGLWKLLPVCEHMGNLTSHAASRDRSDVLLWQRSHTIKRVMQTALPYLAPKVNRSDAAARRLSIGFARRKSGSSAFAQAREKKSNTLTKSTQKRRNTPTSPIPRVPSQQARRAFSFLALVRLANCALDDIVFSGEKDTVGVREVGALFEMLVNEVELPTRSDRTRAVQPTGRQRGESMKSNSSSTLSEEDTEYHRGLDCFGRRIQCVEVLPAILGLLAIVKSTHVRVRGLKTLSMLYICNASNILRVVSLVGWQVLLLPIFCTIPLKANMRSSAQRETANLVLFTLVAPHSRLFFGNLLDQTSNVVPINSLISTTLYHIAVHTSWTTNGVNLARQFMRTLLKQILAFAKESRKFGGWQYDARSPEWDHLFRIMDSVETFIFFRPDEATTGEERVQLTFKPETSGNKLDHMKKADVSHGQEYTNLQSTLPLPPANSEFTVLWKDQPFEPVINMVTDREQVETNRQRFAKWLPERNAKGARGQVPGIHLSEDGKCEDAELAMLVVDIWSACGVYLCDDDEENSERGVNASNESKKAKDRVEMARRWTSFYANAGNLFEDIETSHASMKKGKKPQAHWRPHWYSKVMARVVAFLHTQHRNLSSSTGIIIAGARRESVRHGNAVALGHARRRTIHVAEAQSAQVVSLPPPPPPPSKSPAPPIPSRSESTHISINISAYPPPPPRAEDECKMCNKPCLDDGVSQIIVYAGHKFHDDCFKCSECKRSMLDSISNVNVRFTDDGKRPLLLCGLACREAELLRRARSAPLAEVGVRTETRGSPSPAPGVSCANCISELNTESSSGDQSGQVVLACNKYWHMNHFDCTSCGTGLSTSSDEKSKHYEYSGWPYCKPCYMKDFSTCSKCELVIRAGEDAVNALGRTFHSKCFGCDICQTHFAQGEPFYVGGADEQGNAEEEKDEDNDNEHGHGWNQKAYCREHYFEYAFPRCDTCDGVLAGGDSKAEQLVVSNIKLGNALFHPSPECFKCTSCQIPLSQQSTQVTDDEDGGVFSHMGKPFCDSCYLSQHAPACDACGGQIVGDVVSTDILMPSVGGNDELEGGRKHTLSYHPKCFHCVSCDMALVETDKFTVQYDGAKDVYMPYCQKDYDAEFASRKCAGCHWDLEMGRSNAGTKKRENRRGSSRLSGMFGRKSSASASTFANHENNTAEDVDTMILSFEEQLWHSQCLRCQYDGGCSELLWSQDPNYPDGGTRVLIVGAADESGSLLCRTHLAAQSLGPCMSCGLKFDSPGDMVEPVKGMRFHHKHFMCGVCSHTFEPGEGFTMGETEENADNKTPSKLFRCEVCWN